MFGSLSVKKVIVIAVLISCALVLVGCSGTATPTTSAPAVTQPASKSSIELSQATVDPSVTSINITGTGFTPGSVITGGIPALKPQKNIPESQGVWFLIAQVDDKGNFNSKVDLAGGLWRMLVEKQITEDALAGVYTVVAEDNKGIKAEAKLTITKSKPK